jgi:hypothetical protein
VKWLLLLSFACSTLPHAQVEYYVGTITIQSPIHKKVLGTTPLLIRRTIDPTAGQILEEVVQSDKINGKIVELVITYTKIRNNTFKLQDQEELIQGKIKFKGAEWNWNEWKISYQQKDGSNIIGNGKIEDGQYSATKKLIKNQKTLFIISENLQSTDRNSYKKMLFQLRQTPKE